MEEDKFLIFNNFYFIEYKGEIYIISKKNIDEFKKFYLNEDNEANYLYYRDKPKVGCALYWNGFDTIIGVNIILPLNYGIFDPHSPTKYRWEKFISSVIPFLESDPNDLRASCMLELIEKYDFFRFINDEKRKSESSKDTICE